MNTLHPIVALVALSLTGAAHAALVLENSEFDPRSGVTLTLDVEVHDFAATRGLALSFGQLRATTPGTVIFDYYGNEAGRINELFVPALGAQAILSGGPDEWATGLGAPLASSPALDVAAGLLGFGICSSGGGQDVPGFGKCAWNHDAASLHAQWAFREDHGYRSLGFHLLAPNHWLVFYDDCGLTADDDYDDLVLGIRFTPTDVGVPEPGALGLLGAGLALFGIGRRRAGRHG
jgi:hypothetical protein